jgi:acetoin utilization deacetylase AcuC-like enzyme
MTTLLVTHAACLAHDMGYGHPERPDRLRAIEQALEEERFAHLARAEAPRAEREAVLRVHPEPYLEALERASPAEGLTRLDPDTAMCPGTVEGMLRAAGGAVLATREVFGRQADNAFVATRPPGHHAERARAMGFCFLNNAAIAAREAMAKFGAERVAIVDFDVHHGNGTQDIFWSDPHVMYASTHQMPLYPGTGARAERGEHDNIVNAPLRAGDGGDAFRDVFETAILPRLDAFSPDFLIISAGFDAHRRDPLGGLDLVEDDYVWVTRRLMEIAARHSGGRLVSVLEGGYDLQALGRSTAAHVLALMGAG